MAAPNFYVKNANAYYVVFDEVPEDLAEAEWFDMLVEDKMDEIERLLKERIKKLGASYTPVRETHNFSPNYPEFRIGTITYEHEFPYGDGTFERIYVEASIHIILRYGYYAGAVLDWEVEGPTWEDSSTGYITEDAKTLMDDVFHDYWNTYVEVEYGDCDSDGCEAFYKLTKEAYEQLAEHMQNTIDETVSKIIKAVEEVYREISTPMEVVAGFSNGETIYEPIKKEESER